MTTTTTTTALDAHAGSQQSRYIPIRKMVDKNLQRMSLRTVLRLTTGVPLFLGIVILVAVSMHLMTSNATGWMAPVVTSLESEETSSLQRLAVAQAGFAEEVVAQMFDEINLAQDYATKILSNDFVKTSGTMPVDAYHYTLPLSVDSVGVLEYDKNKIKIHHRPRQGYVPPFQTKTT